MGRREDPLEGVGVIRCPLLEQAEDRPAVVVDDDDGEIGTRFARAEDEAGEVVDEGDVTDERDRAGRARRAGQGDPDGRREGAVDPRQPAVGHDEPALAGSARAEHEVEVADGVGRADDERRPRRHGLTDPVGDLESVEGGEPVDEGVECVADPLVGGLPSGEPHEVVGIGSVRRHRRWDVEDGGRPRRVGRDPAGPSHGDHLDVGPGQQGGLGARQGRVPHDNDALDLPPQRTRQEEPVGTDRVIAHARSRRRFREQRPPGALGEQPCRRAGLVAGEDDGAGPGFEDHAWLGWLRWVPDVEGVCRVVSISLRPPRLPGLGQQRGIERQVEVDRARDPTGPATGEGS